MVRIIAALVSLTTAQALTPVPEIIEVEVPVYLEDQQTHFGGGGSCFKPRTEYSPLNMYGTSRSTEVNIEACQRRCRAVQGCTVFAFWPDGGCHLQDIYAVPNTLKPNTEAISGPAYCPSTPSNNYCTFGRGFDRVVVQSGRRFTSSTGKTCVCNNGVFEQCIVNANTNPCQASMWSPTNCHDCNNHAQCVWQSHKGGFCNHVDDVGFHNQPQAKCGSSHTCRSQTSCFDCFSKFGCNWDRNDRMCRENAECDYTNKPNEPVAVPYVLSGYSAPVTCLASRQQCDTWVNPLLDVNKNGDSCASVTDCYSCSQTNGCAFDITSNLCVATNPSSWMCAEHSGNARVCFDSFLCNF